MDDLKRKSVDEQARGTGQSWKGKIEEGAGKVTGNKDWEAEGKADQAEGDLRKGLGKAGRAASDAAERLGEKLGRRDKSDPDKVD